MQKIFILTNREKYKKFVIKVEIINILKKKERKNRNGIFCWRI